MVAVGVPGAVAEVVAEILVHIKEQLFGSSFID